MPHEIKKPYSNKIDLSFKAAAAAHQSKFREENLMLPSDKHENHLMQEDAEKGANFFKSLGIFDAVKLHAKFHKSLYTNMLRSEHIPFNFFIPLKNNPELAKNFFNELFKNKIQSIDNLKIEYSPKPAKKFLNDETYFDVYIEYTHKDKAKGVIGISLKYTENTYPVAVNSEEDLALKNPQSVYYQVTEKTHFYKPEHIAQLSQDKFREIWQRQLLGEAILQKTKSPFKYATLILMYPKGNLHLGEVAAEYSGFLKPQQPTKFIHLTYENFLSALRKATKEQRFLDWAKYLNSRYIVRS